jgi:hypothetical protein
MARKKDIPNPWAIGESPLPDSNEQLVDEIKALAAARRQDTLSHPEACTCDGCLVRRSDEIRQAVHRNAA